MPRRPEFCRAGVERLLDAGGGAAGSCLEEAVVVTLQQEGFNLCMVSSNTPTMAKHAGTAEEDRDIERNLR